jgi:broad specificity phosphatase PhoE
MGEVVVVRHGQTEWSVSGRHTGRTDVALTPTGEQQAAAVGRTLRGRSFAAVLSSPLIRARRTAEIAGFAAPQVDPDLVEWDYGGYEGLTTAEIRAQVGHAWTIFVDGVPPGATPGESLAQVAARADRVIARMRVHLVQGDVLIFSHGHLLRVLAARWVAEPPGFGARLALGTATISRLGTEHDLPVVQEWNRVPG